MADTDRAAAFWIEQLRTGTPAQQIEALDEIGRIFEERGQLEEAAEAYESLIRRGVREPATYLRLARVYERQGRDSLANEVREEARRLDTLPPPSGGRAEHPRGSVLIRRLVAFLIDGPIIWILGAFVSIAWALTDPVGFDRISDSRRFERGLSILLFGFYAIPLWTLKGATIGKQLVGLRLVNGRGDSPNVLRSIVRFVVMFMLSGLFGLTWWPVLFRRDGRGFHDLAAGTTVISVNPRETYPLQRFAERWLGGGKVRPCPQCGYSNSSSRTTCKRCRSPLGED